MDKKILPQAIKKNLIASIMLASMNVFADDESLEEITVIGEKVGS